MRRIFLARPEISHRDDIFNSCNPFLSDLIAMMIILMAKIFWWNCEMKIKEMMEICRESESGDYFDCVDDIRSAVYHGPWLVYHYDDDDDDDCGDWWQRWWDWWCKLWEWWYCRRRRRFPTEIEAVLRAGTNTQQILLRQIINENDMDIHMDAFGK